MEKLDPDVDSLTAMGEKLISKSSGPALANIKQNLANLHQRWDHVRNRANDRKVRRNRQRCLWSSVGVLGDDRFYTALFMRRILCS